MIKDGYPKEREIKLKKAPPQIEYGRFPTIKDEYPKEREIKLKKELLRIGKELHRLGYVTHRLGTISAKVCTGLTGRVFVVKSISADYLDLTENSFVCVNDDGKSLEEDKRGPSLNWLAHRACYDADPKIEAVIHAHTPKTNALISQANQNFPDWCSNPAGVPSCMPIFTQEGVWMLDPYKDSSPGIPIAEDGDPHELAYAAPALISRICAFLIRNHGIIAVGPTLLDALGVVEAAENEARQMIDALSTRGKPFFRGPTKFYRDLEMMPDEYKWRNYHYHKNS